MSQLTTWWSTPFFQTEWKDHNQLSEMLIELIYEDSKKIDADIVSNVAPDLKHGMKESSLNFFYDNKEDHRLILFVDWLKVEILNYYNSIAIKNYSLIEKSTKQYEYNVVFRDSWYHITKNGGYHDAHHHPHCSICGIYYLDIGNSSIKERNGINRFWSPIKAITDSEDCGFSWAENEVLDVEPKNGTLVLFPSYVTHNATPYRGDKDRIVLAFNAQVHKKSVFEKDTVDGLFNIFNGIGVSEVNLFDEDSNTSI